LVGTGVVVGVRGSPGWVEPGLVDDGSVVEGLVVEGLVVPGWLLGLGWLGRVEGPGCDGWLEGDTPFEGVVPGCAWADVA
jgi:hypothetical protein